MYSDPALIRKHVVKLSLNDREEALINAYCEYSGEQKAALLRDMLMNQVAEFMHGLKSDIAPVQLQQAN
jgi:hypothetical protein